ncbi:MAG TPA: diguanylate cyclase [Thermoleophilaceae bacterium]|nr:diguanylate cyclase [Thermoleophilaceae bacterium]
MGYARNGNTAPRLTIGRRLGLLVGLLVLATMAVAVIGAVGVSRVDQKIHTFYTGTFERAAITVELRGALKDTKAASLEYALVEEPARRRALETAISGSLVPSVDTSLDKTEDQLSHASEPVETRRALVRLRKNWQAYLERFGPALFAASPAGEQGAAEAIRAVLDRLIADAEILAEGEADHATAAIEDTAAYADTIRLGLIITAALAALIAGGIAFLLTRRLVLRTRDYSRFASAVAAGSFGERLHLRGNDELTDLGELLNRMVDHRDAEQTQSLQRSEFTEAMQLTGSESDAHNLLKRHLERSIPGSVVTVLSRNNSADRLEPTTAVDPADSIAEGLREAAPEDCLAVRSGQAQRRDGKETLLTCKICGQTEASACQPLLVGGEVIGSVLASRDIGLSESESETMRGSVTQAAPLLANLRNLALAELRAGTDSLTGLPNQRASHETLQRMMAQSDRTRQPLSVLMLDLDHFKQVNDVFGHAAGDNVLAAVGVTLRSSVRDADFCGRFGGEEFIALLPNTDLAGAGVVAEKIRAGVELIQVPAVERGITVSIGVATAPEHGVDVEVVARLADRALYAAKEAGRNRVELAAVSDAPLEFDPPTVDVDPALP